MNNKFLISLVILVTLFIGCGTTSSDSGTDTSSLTASITGDILVVEGMKKDVKLSSSRENVTFQIVNKDNNIDVEINRYTGILVYWPKNDVGMVENIVVKAVDDTGWESDSLTLSFKTVDDSTSATQSILKTGADDNGSGIAREFKEDSDGNIIDPLGNIWENDFDAKALESKMYLLAKNRCEIKRLSHKGTNWRVPTVNELLNLMDYSKASGTTMMEDIFQNPNLTTWAKAEGNNYYVVSPINGLALGVPYIEKYPVRCINAPDIGDHIVSTEIGQRGKTIDFTSGLQWTPITSDSSRRIIDDVNQTAAQYCQEYDNGSGWRLPSFNEIRSIVENQSVSNSILGANNILVSSTTYNNSDPNAKSANYIITVGNNGIIYEISYADELYPITCVKER